MSVYKDNKSGKWRVIYRYTDYTGERKQQADDRFERISGTNGLLGAADGAFLLHKDKRTSCEVVLNVSGRDRPDQTFYLNRNEDFLVWEPDKTETERRTEKPDQIVKEARYKNVAAFTKAFERACEAIKEGQGADIQKKIQEKPSILVKIKAYDEEAKTGKAITLTERQKNSKQIHTEEIL